MRIIHEQPISNEVAYDLLKQSNADSYRAERTIKYLEKVGFIKNSEKLLSKLLSLGLTKEKAIIIINTMPKTNDEVRTILENEYSQELSKKILELIREYASK